MKIQIAFILLILCVAYCSADELKLRNYSFTVYDGTLNLFTMRQFNEGYTSLHRMTMRALADVLGDKNINGAKLSDLLSFIPSFIFKPFTHEEGHRSIAVHLGYGAFSNPFFDLTGRAFSEVEISEEYPISYFRRLYSAGIESDYLMCRNATLSAAFRTEESAICFFDFCPRISMSTTYLLSSLMVGKVFENNGYVKKIFAYSGIIRDYEGYDPISLTASFFHEDVGYFYEDYSDISDEEKVFLDRIALRSLVNFVNPFMIGTPSIKISDSFSFSVFMNYSLCPFGDFIEETAAVKYNNINADIYIRQYQNKDFWFPSFGIGIRNYEFASFSVDAGFHFWMQPEELSFISSIRKPGCAGEVKLTWFIPNSKDFPIKSTGLSLGVSGKTKGFLPGYESHDNALRLSAGFTIRY
jgi:hypothetical protein